MSFALAMSSYLTIVPVPTVPVTEPSELGKRRRADGGGIDLSACLSYLLNCHRIQLLSQCKKRNQSDTAPG